MGASSGGRVGKVTSLGDSTEALRTTCAGEDNVGDASGVRRRTKIEMGVQDEVSSVGLRGTSRSSLLLSQAVGKLLALDRRGDE